MATITNFDQVIVDDGLQLTSSTPSVTTNKIYNVGGSLYFNGSALATGGGLSNIVEDTTPQLGGTLDANGNTIDMGTYVITDAKVGQWDTAYGWGDHSSAGYLTSQTSHADVVVDGDFTSQGIMLRGASAGSYSILTDNSSNWNTAYGWGDHSSQGYATLASPTFTGTPAAPTAAAGTNTTQVATTAYVTTAIDNLVGGAPGALDTLNELAAAINDDASYASTITTALATKLENIVEDTTPQLGGDLDLNGNQILDCVTESSATTNVPLVVQGITSQTADLAQFKSTSSTVQSKIDSAGRLLFSSNVVPSNPSSKGIGMYGYGVAIFDSNTGDRAFYVLRDGSNNYTQSNTNDFRLFSASSSNAVHLKAANTFLGTPTDGLAVYDDDGTTLGEIKCDYANIDINSTTANGITVTAAASQSAELQLWENSSSTKLLAVGPDGGLEIPSNTPSTTTNKLHYNGTSLRFGNNGVITSDRLGNGLSWNSITQTLSASIYTQEQIEDYAGNLISTGGTKTGITVTYQDATNDVDFVVGGLTTTEFAAATLVTAAEGIGSNNNDTTIPTSAAVKAYADSVAGGGSPGGSDTQIQFNDGGSFGGDADLVWNKTTNALTINGSLNATTKSFLIDHPSKPGMKLQYASLEGPENGVYVRGTTDSGTITLPDYWRDLVHNGSITVTLTPVGQFQPLFVEQKNNREIRVGGVCGYYDYVVYGERKDVDKLEVEW